MHVSVYVGVSASLTPAGVHKACWREAPQSGACHVGTVTGKARVAGQRPPAEGNREAETCGRRSFNADGEDLCLPREPAGH